MATTPDPLSASHSPPFFQQSHSPVSSEVHDIPEQLSPAQVEAKKILGHIFEKLKETNSKYYPRYGEWVERNPGLDGYCFQCIRPQVWAFLDGRWSLDGLKSVGADLRFEGRGVYLNGVLGLDKRVRIYVGQANCLRQRFTQHLNFRYRRDNPSLHYHALQKSIYNAFGTLAVVPLPKVGNSTLPGMDCPDLLLNVLEMWMSLVFRSLPTQALEAWIPEDVNANRKEGKEGEFGGLNIAVPLDQGAKEKEWLDLSECGDALVQEYLGVGQRKLVLEQKQHSSVPSASEKQKDMERDAAVQRKRTDSVEEVFAERRRKYKELAKRRRSKAYSDIPVSPVTVVAIGVAVVFGIMLLRNNGGPASAPASRGRWR